MKRILTASALVAGLLVTAAPALVAAPAHALNAFPYLPPGIRTVCLRLDFAAAGSGWPVQAAIRDWNEAQSVILLTTDLVPGCMVVPVHRYNDPEGEATAYTSIQGTVLDGVHYSTRDEVWLNDAGHPKQMGRAYARSVVAHELGHVMGLDHNTSTRSVMSYSRGVRPGHSVIAPVDVRNLAAIYDGLRRA